MFNQENIEIAADNTIILNSIKKVLRLSLHHRLTINDKNMQNGFNHDDIDPLLEELWYFS